MIGQPGRFGTFALIWATVLNFAIMATIWARLAARMLGAV